MSRVASSGSVGVGELVAQAEEAGLLGDFGEPSSFDAVLCETFLGGSSGDALHK